MAAKCSAIRLGMRCAALVACAAVSACQRADVPLPPATSTDGSVSAPAEEVWEAFYLQNAKIGYGRTTVRGVRRDGRPLVETDSLNHLSISRFGQLTEQDLKTRSLETPQGQVIEFHTELSFGPSPTLVDGHVEGQQMVITTRTKGSQTTSGIGWSADILGFRGVEQSLERQPLQPGQKRTLKILMPLVNQVAEVELTAGQLESTEVLGVQTKLLRIESAARLPDGNGIAATLWTDAQGRSIKTRVDALQQESYRTTQELAISEQPEGARIDLGLDLIVKLDRPFKGHAARQVRYRVELAGADASKAFASGPTQTVRALDSHAAEVTVRSMRPKQLPRAPGPVAPPGKEFTGANSVLQIDDARIKAMAREAQGGATSAADAAIALERYVHRIMTKKNFKQAFATAAEVAESREGDCSEHAVLLAALARACQIPSRVAIGLVYVEGAGGFGYHMWTELYLDGWWVPMDAVWGAEGTSAAYLKLTDSSLDGSAAYSSFLAVAQVVGQLKISVIEEE